MKIVVLDGFTENPGDLMWAGFEKLGELRVYERTTKEQAVERIADADALIINKVAITRELLDSCPSIKYIGVLATGYNVVDIDAATERGIPVCNIPSYGTSAVAQYVFALLLEVCHHVGHHNNQVKAGVWTNSIDFCFWDYPLIELKDKTMGIIGFGRIGQNTAKIAKAFGMNVIAYDKFFDKNASKIATEVTLDELLAKSDVISLHCPLSAETEGMINKSTISKMKNGVIIINTSRGPLIVESDLKEALDSGKIYGAAVDVVSKEPIEENNPLLACENCIITPHIAWASKESRARLMDIAIENLRSFSNGKTVNAVNMK